MSHIWVAYEKREKIAFCIGKRWEWDNKEAFVILLIIKSHERWLQRQVLQIFLHALNPALISLLVVLLALLVMMLLVLALWCLVFAWVGSATGHRLHDHCLRWIRHWHWLWHRHGHRHGHGHGHGHRHRGCGSSLTGARCLTGSSTSCTRSGCTKRAQASQHLLEAHGRILLGSASLEGCAGLCLCVNRNSATFKGTDILWYCYLLCTKLPQLLVTFGETKIGCIFLSEN